MPLNEPRIFTNKPRWYGLEELSRTEKEVWFKTRSGRMMVPRKYVDEYERNHG
jgi:hypothetical protein